MFVIWLILLIFNIFFYGACIMLIMKRKNFTSISIRSPNLLILNNIGNLFMSIIIIISKFFKDKNGENNKGKKIVSMFYYLTNFLMIIPFCLRFHRLIKCCAIYENEKRDTQIFSKKKYSYEEKYYIKYTFIIFGILFLILVISDIPLKLDDAFTVNFLFLKNDKSLETAKRIIWMIINFIEHIILLTFAYKICIYRLKQKLRFEIISSFIIWFLYSNTVSYLESPDENHDNIIIYISLGFCYLFLILNAIIPVLISYSYHYSIGYHFTSNLMNNLYLFLSDAYCYKIFANYLNELQGNGLYYLKMYTQIINYKLGFKLKIDNEQGFLEACSIRDKYFNNLNIEIILPKEIVDKIKKDCQELDNNNHFTEDMYDEALQYCYNELINFFNDFKNTDKFKKIYEDYYISSYIYCKMHNVGLINKF